MRQEKILQTYSDSQKIKESIKGSDGNQILKSWTYFANGKLKSETLGSLDAQKGGATTGYEYDQWNRLIKVKYPDGQSEEYEYNKNDQVTKIKYADGSVKINEYNKTGFLTKETDEEGNVTEHGYNIWGEETKRTELNISGSGNQIWKRSYNGWNQVTEEENNQLQKWVYSYDKRGLLVSRRDPKGIVITTGYDANGNVISEIRKLGTKTETKSYAYDAAGFMYQAIDNGVMSILNSAGGKYEANAWGLITSYKTVLNGEIMTTLYSYDRALNNTRTVYPDLKDISYEYNRLGQLQEIKESSDSGRKYLQNAEYDNAGNLISFENSNGTGRKEQRNSTTHLLEEYDWEIPEKANRILKWNNRGDIIEIKGDDNKLYSYDELNRLVYEDTDVNVSLSGKNKFTYGYAEDDVTGKQRLKYDKDNIKFDYYASSIGLEMYGEKTGNGKK